MLYKELKMLKEDLQNQLKVYGYRGEFDLSSLIEACGEGFYVLKHNLDGQWECIPSNTLASSYFGSTPEEAVARLYISLQKK